MTGLRRWQIIALASLLLIVGGGLTAFFFLKDRPALVRLAGGSPRSESYRLAEAIRDVLVAHRGLKVAVVETAGSADSMAKLDAGEVEFILSQADAKPCPSARLVARMFPEDFQLIARAGSGIANFADVRGRRVGLATPGSGQHASFWFLASHYDIPAGGVQEVAGRDADVDDMFIREEVDAVFRVRPPQNTAIQRLVREGNGVLIPIDQGGALVLKQSALERSTIPKGAYHGAPAIPPDDLPTVSAPRLMFARETAPPSLVREITAALYELRHNLVEAMPLASFISPPSADRPAVVPLHDGARRYYDREKPNFFQENADYVALILTVVIGVASWVWGLKRHLDRARKNRADHHNLELTNLMEQASRADSPEIINEIRQRLVSIFREVVQELDTGHLDAESLQSFALVWNAASHAARDREGALSKR